MSAPSLRLPDGSSLGAALASFEASEERTFGAKPRLRRLPAAERKWLAATGGAAPAKPSLSSWDANDIDTAAGLSRRRQRRWLNEVLLRELAGPLSATSIAELYCPVPFGHTRVSAFQRLSSSVALDDFIEALDAGASAEQCSTATTHAQDGSAASAWARIGRRGRMALRRCVASKSVLLEEVELALRSFACETGTETLVLPGDAYRRLVTHSLAAYLGLASASFSDEQGNRCTLVRRRCGAAPTDLPPCSQLIASF